MSSPTHSGPLHVVWFKRDLRIDDHRALAAAFDAAGSDGFVLPLYVAEADWWAGPDMAARQWAFVEECVTSLRGELAALGQPLVIRTGYVTAVLDDLRTTHGLAGLWSHEETGGDWTYTRDRDVLSWSKAHGVPWTEIPQNGVIRRLKSRDGWARRWDRLMGEDITPPPPALRPIEGLALGKIPSAAALGLADDPCPERQAGGRAAALHCLQTFLDERGETYRAAMSSPVSGFDACSRLSPHLAWGTISAREVAQATWARQRHLKHAVLPEGSMWRGSMQSFSGRLHWRCHFSQKLEDEPTLEVRNLHRAYDGMRPAETDHARLMAWSRGETGLPFVDACMRALNATGWMNFRMRAMLMAVSSYHLWLDWRTPGEHLARKFTDYDPGIHWPQVQMQSGTTGINTVRIYNPVKQGHDQDPDGAFIRQWLPELAAIPDSFIHEPWKWDDGGKTVGSVYPYPIVDYLAAAKQARQRIYGVRKSGAFRREADGIQHKHGSRKSGIPMRGRDGTSRRKRAG